MSQTPIFRIGFLELAGADSPSEASVRKIYETLARRSGTRLDARTLALPESEFEGWWSSPIAAEFDGLVIAPGWQVRSRGICAELTAEATRVGSVNVLLRRDGKWIGHNSELGGMRGSLEDTSRTFRSGVVFGSGRAGRVALAALDDLGVRELSWVSRDSEKLEEVGFELTPQAVVTLCDYGGDFDADLYVNATPVGAPGAEPGSAYTGKFRPESFVYEMIAAPEWTEFRSRARAQGCASEGGLDLLVQQALVAWEFWGQAGLETSSDLST